MELRLLAPAAGEAAVVVAAIAAIAAIASAAAAVEDAGAAEAAFTLMMPLMEEGASAPLELSRGGSQPKVSPRSSPGGSYPPRRLRCRPHCHFVRMPHEKKQPVAC